MTPVQVVTHLVGADSPEVLAKRLVLELGPGRQADAAEPQELLLELAKRDHFVGPNASNLSVIAAINSVAVLDLRIQVMLLLARQLAIPPGFLISHESFIRGLYEHPRLFGHAASGTLAEVIVAIAARCEPGVDAEDEDLFVEHGQPTLLFYDALRNYLDGRVASAKDAEDEEGEDEEEDDDDDTADVDQPVRALVKTFMVQQLVLLADEKQLDIDPAWQRSDVWSLKKKRELIRSLLLGIPLPSIILHSRAGKMSIIDGKQRLLSIFKFVKNEFKLPKYEVPPSSPLYACRGAYYDNHERPSLGDAQRSELRMRDLPALVFEDVPEARLRGIFHLYNVAGMKLNAAEIRNAVYQANSVHQVLYVLAGEANGRADVGVGGLAVQERFKRTLRRFYPGATRRYQGVDFLARYLGYSRAAQADPTKAFGAPSTSRAINNYFDTASIAEDAKAIGMEIITVFDGTSRYFDDVDGDRLVFFARGADGRRKFSKLSATTYMIATRLLLRLIEIGSIDEARARQIGAALYLPVPEKQQSATIWDYQARVMLKLRAALGEEVVHSAGGEWALFFEKMEYCILPSVGHQP